MVIAPPYIRSRTLYLGAQQLFVSCLKVSMVGTLQVSHPLGGGMVMAFGWTLATRLIFSFWHNWTKVMVKEQNYGAFC